MPDITCVRLLSHVIKYYNEYACPPSLVSEDYRSSMVIEGIRPPDIKQSGCQIQNNVHDNNLIPI